MASKMERQRETAKFVGCILSVKTKPGIHGEVKNVIGTVRDIDVDSDEQAIILDDAMANGVILPDGYVLMSGQIADLTVIGRADELEGSSRDEPSPPLIYGGSQPIGISQHRVHNDLGNVSDNGSSTDSSSTVEDDPAPKVLNISKGQVPKSQVSVGNVLLNSFSVPSTQSSNPPGPTGIAGTVGVGTAPVRSHKIAKPKPRKAQPGMVYSHSAATSAGGNEFMGQNGRNKASKVSLGSLFGSSTTTSSSSGGVISSSSNNLKSTSSTTMISTGSSSVSINYKELNREHHQQQVQVPLSSIVLADFPKENILTQTFGSLTGSSSMSSGGSGGGSSMPLNGASLFNTLASAAAANSNDVLIGSGTGGSGKIKIKQEDPSGLMMGTGARQKNQYDGKKLGVLSQFLTGGIPKTIDQDNGRQQLSGNQYERSTRSKGSFGKPRHGDNGETFGMVKAEMTEEFDFEGSNAQFEKLPVSATKPVKVVKDPYFTSEDTTHLAERMVESVRIRGAVGGSKKFVTDTGIAIPAVDLPTRSKILNLSHDLGLTHSRMIEAFARAVVQTCLPVLGDTYRLSPEREEDRPWVLVCAGPHWQGAVGIAAARILASFGVRTYVHSPKEEVSVCAVEEKLYSLTREPFTRNIADLGRRKFELVIMAMDDHLVRSVSLPLYSRWLSNASVVFVDPPLISSYREPLELLCGKGEGGRVIVISPALPLAYSQETSVKFYLVNLGIPQEIFLQNDVIYKSPFGDKMVIQIFSCKQSPSTATTVTDAVLPLN